MSLTRHAGAPRLIDWTGERCVPWSPDVQVIYEHLHRYLWAARLLVGRRVLELGSGEGFGASILIDGAQEVVGVDIDPQTVEHARLNWGAENVSFEVGSATDLSAFPDDSFDAVVAFEVIEHLSEQERMLAEINRVLRPGGLLIVSTPDRRLYSEASGQENPFHERELSRDEFTALLEGHFANVAVWGQRTITGSQLSAAGGSSSATEMTASFYVERAGEEWRVAADPAAVYMVAVASDEDLPVAPLVSTLADCDLALLRSGERATADRLLAHGDALSNERDLALTRARLMHERAELLQRELGHRSARAGHLRGELLRIKDEIHTARRQVAEMEGRLIESRRVSARMEESVSWQVFEAVRRRLFGLIGEDSVAARSLRLLLRLGGRLIRRRRAVAVASSEPAAEPLVVLPVFEDPIASLVVPLHSRADLTLRCLQSIRDNTDHIGYEVILVDDTADEETKALLARVEGARVLVNERNEGYLRSVNAGAAVAEGEWIVLCNNDIEVHEDWLRTMIDCAESRESIGVVAPKFVAPDGSLSEAGGILWRDGTGWNYGRGEAADHFRYNFTREIDYGSAAALLVKRELWLELGGYDTRFAPMYYEDADLCMAARSRGWRVMYEPHAVVMHAEGSTAGTDTTSGHKRHQETNRAVFLEKWQAVLERDHLPFEEADVGRAAGRLRIEQALVVDFRVPMWDRDAGSLRIFEIIRALQRRGLSVTMLPDNLYALQPYTRELQRLGVEVITGPVDLLPELDAIGAKLRLAILSRPHSASRWLDTIREYAPDALLLYDTVDLHWVREARRHALIGGTVPNGDPRKLTSKASALRELELALVRASDMTIAVTNTERAEIEREVPGARIVVIPTVHEVSADVAPVAGRGGVLFVGGFEHPPNVDAARFLVEEVMPLVWKRAGEVAVTIVGGSPPPDVLALASERVEVPGWVQNLHPLLEKARVMAVPVRYGAGVKGKVTQALAAGLPVITTPLGAEGLDGIDGESMLIGADAETLAERILAAVGDDALWERVSRGGQDLVVEKCSLQVLDRRLGEVMQAIQAPVGS